MVLYISSSAYVMDWTIMSILEVNYKTPDWESRLYERHVLMLLACVGNQQKIQTLLSHLNELHHKPKPCTLKLQLSLDAKRSAKGTFTEKSAAVTSAFEQELKVDSGVCPACVCNILKKGMVVKSMVFLERACGSQGATNPPLEAPLAAGVLGRGCICCWCNYTERPLF